MNYAQQIEEIEKLEKASAHLSQPYINLLTLARKMQEEINRVEKHNFILKTMGQIYVKEEWVPCSERLPEKSGTYFVTVERCSMPNHSMTDYFSTLKGDWSREGVHGMKITAWMPLPEPFKEAI